MRKSLRRSPETNLPRGFVTVTPTFTRFTVARSEGPCCAGKSCATSVFPLVSSHNARVSEVCCASVPDNARRDLFNPSIEVHTMHVFPGSTGGEVQMARENLRISVLERIRQ